MAIILAISIITIPLDTISSDKAYKVEQKQYPLTKVLPGQQANNAPQPINSEDKFWVSFNKIIKIPLALSAPGAIIEIFPETVCFDIYIGFGSSCNGG